MKNRKSPCNGSLVDCKPVTDLWMDPPHLGPSSTGILTGKHYHPETDYYSLNSTTLNAAQRSETRIAADTWNPAHDFALRYGGTTTSTDPAPDGHFLVWEGNPHPSWVEKGWCRPWSGPGGPTACTRIAYGGDNHIDDMDTVLYWQASWQTDAAKACAENDPESHRAFMVHEFGHWGWLAHTSNPGSVMYPIVRPCMIKPTQKDIWAMEENYDHGGH